AHHRRIVKADSLFDEGETLFGFFHLLGVLGVVLGRLAGHWETDAAVVDTDTVPDLSAEQLIYRHSGDLPCDVPESDLDRAHRRTPGLEGAKPANFQHDALDVRRVLAQDIVLVEEHHWLEIRLGGLGLTVAGDALIRDNSNYRVSADDRTPEVCDFHASTPRPLFRGRQVAPLLSRKRRCGGCARERSDKSSSRPISHSFLFPENPLSQSGFRSRICCKADRAFNIRGQEIPDLILHPRPLMWRCSPPALGRFSCGSLSTVVPCQLGSGLASPGLQPAVSSAAGPPARVRAGGTRDPRRRYDRTHHGASVPIAKRVTRVGGFTCLAAARSSRGSRQRGSSRRSSRRARGRSYRRERESDAMAAPRARCLASRLACGR